LSRRQPPQREDGSSARPAEGPDASRFSALNAAGRQATLSGDYQQAMEKYAEAFGLAAKLGDPHMISVARLNRAMVLITMGEARRGEEGLREILLGTADPRVAFSAAYNLASSLRKQGRYERAMVYARRAMDRSRELGADDLAAGAHNLIGNILLNQSYADDALAEYGRALALRRMLPGDHRFSIAILEENIGYCQLIKGELRDGIDRILGALALADEVGNLRCRAECLQDLCYAHLLLDEFELASDYGEQALTLARDAGYDDVVENCHYMLGEIGLRTGDLERRDLHFELLQERHPELPFLRDFLCLVDVSSIITLKR